MLMESGQSREIFPRSARTGALRACSALAVMVLAFTAGRPATAQEPTALDAARRAVQADPRDAQAWLELAAAQFELGKPAAAKSWQRAYDLDAEQYAEAVAGFYVEDQDALAAEAAKHWTRRAPKDSNAWYYLGLGLLFSERPREAIAPLEKALSLMKPLKEADDKSYVYGHLGFAHLANGDEQAGREAWTHCFFWSPPDCLDAIGDHLDRGEAEPALVAAKVATHLHPDFDDSWYVLALAAIKLERFDEALPAARKAVELDGEDAYNVAVLGHVQVRLGQEQEGERLLRRATDLDDTNALAWGYLAELYGRTGRGAEQEEALERQRAAESEEG